MSTAIATNISKSIHLAWSSLLVIRAKFTNISIPNRKLILSFEKYQKKRSNIQHNEWNKMKLTVIKQIYEKYPLKLVYFLLHHFKSCIRIHFNLYAYRNYSVIMCVLECAFPRFWCNFEILVDVSYMFHC